MFNNSTQHKYWMFKNEEAINKLRDDTNRKFVARHSWRKTTDKNGAEVDMPFLNFRDEIDVLRWYQIKLEEFCAKFSPPMPKCVIGTASTYFKRFYLRNSVMDYHPKEILVTAVYLATKVEEFNVSISQFVANVMGNRERATNIILNNELLLLMELNFHLTVHNPYRPVEGLLIDIKTRCQGVVNVESFRPDVDSFLEGVYRTDAPLIYAPSQIALSAIIHAASKRKQKLDLYVTQQLFGDQGSGFINHIVSIVRQIRIMVKNIPDSAKNLKLLVDRLELCRNEENNPDSEIYKRKLLESVDEEDRFDEPVAKAPRLDTSDLGLQSLE